MTKVNRASLLAAELEKLYPDARCSLDYKGDAWRLLIMTRLSAQCTDERVNIVSRSLFSAYPTAADLAAASQADVETIVAPCGLFRMKARDIIASSAVVAASGVPDNMNDLLALPGVGRKTANLILGDIYHSGGIVADTHCIRICGRLGFYDEKSRNPVACERIMSALLPKRLQSDFCHRLVIFGREICTARTPKCHSCPASHLCRHAAALNLTK